jgi:hypothetical protein
MLDLLSLGEGVWTLVVILRADCVAQAALLDLNNGLDVSREA